MLGTGPHKWALKSTHKIDLGLFSRSLKYLTLCGHQVVHLCFSHDDLSIELIASENTNIEVLPSLFYFDISSYFNVLLVTQIYHILH